MDSQAETTPRWYTGNELFTSPSADLRHFQPGSNGRDRFGNRIFTSRELAYSDREGDTVKASLLVSPEGERFIKTHPGILRAIEKGLRTTQGNYEYYSVKKQEIGEDALLSFLIVGGQSVVYLLETGEETVVIKTRSPRDPDSDPFQPYINEMLQVQSVGKDLETELAELNLSLQTFMFASGQISCARFENGKHPHSLNHDFLSKVSKLLTGYIKKQKHNPLWNNIKNDIYGWQNFTDIPRYENFIQKEGGGLVFIDPFFYYSEGEGLKKLTSKFSRLVQRFVDSGRDPGPF